jgi:hypothetical protein
MAWKRRDQAPCARDITFTVGALPQRFDEALASVGFQLERGLEDLFAGTAPPPHCLKSLKLRQIGLGDSRAAPTTTATSSVYD